MKKSEIKLTISLDENQVPEKIQWEASDSGEPGVNECKAFLMSLWDAKQNNTLRIDLWTKEMMVDEMKHFCYQSLITMADTFERATGDKEMAEELRTTGKKMAERINN